MTLHLTIRPVTEWLALAAVGVFITGLLLMCLTGRWLEIGSLAFASLGTWIAIVLAVLAIGSLFY